MGSGRFARSQGRPLGLAQEEATVLIDPITDDARLISYEMDEDACIAVPLPGVNNSEKDSVTATIDILGLNRLDRLNQNCADTWKSVVKASPTTYQRLTNLSA